MVARRGGAHRDDRLHCGRASLYRISATLHSRIHGQRWWCMVASISSLCAGVGQAREGHREGRSASVEAPVESSGRPRPMGVGLAKAGVGGDPSSS
jgi:hypothetical protein